MSEPPEKSTEEHSTPIANASTFVITRELFDQVPLYRSRYILLYIAILLWWILTRVFMGLTNSEPPFIPSATLLVILYAAFYLSFFKTMRILGWPLWWIAPTMLVVSIPILGVLPMGVIDRRIADQWDKADDEHTHYRERVYAEDIEDEDDV